RMGRDRTDASPSHVLEAAAENSGIVVAAFDLETDRAVGFAWGFLARDEKGLYHYSHQSAVVEELKYSGLGFRIKQAQRELALEQGLTRARWTFDPLQGLNTRFNLGKLGVVSWEYVVNYYGEINDEINRGLRTDRLKVWWFLDSERVRRKAEGELGSPSLKEALEAGAEEVMVLDSGVPKGFKRVESELVLIEVPYSVSEARERGTVGKWREHTAEAMLYYMNKGYVDFEAVYDRKERRVFHLLWKRPLKDILDGMVPW
ncbi:MAG: hypothetical protein QI199_05565, partial [Candidatus Korarchaeota archaeon]|nr:hypothetical protein [Candidatus Korarchaeota archaeon]